MGIPARGTLAASAARAAVVALAVSCTPPSPVSSSPRSTATAHPGSASTAAAPIASDPLPTRLGVYRHARAALDEGRIDDAARALEIAQTVLPELADYVLIDAARVATAKGDTAGARALYGRVLAEHPESVWVAQAASEAAEIALSDADATSAVALFERARANASGVEASTATLGLARAQAKLGDTTAAYVSVDDIRGTAGRRNDDARELGESLAALGPEALGQSREELALRQARARLREGRVEDAAAALGPALAPTSRRRAEATLVLARIRLRGGTLDEAFASFGEAARFSDSGDVAGVALYERGRALWNRNDDALAEQDFTALLERFPDHPKALESLNALGRIAETRGDTAAAVSRYEEAARRFPSEPLASELAWRAAFVRYRGGDAVAAAAAFAALPTVDAEATYWRARALDRAGKHEEARGLYRTVATSDDEYHAWWAESRLGGGGSERGDVRGWHDLDTPAPALSLPPPALGASATYHYSRGEILRALGMRTSARREYAAAESAGGPDPSLLDPYRDLGAYDLMVRLARRLSPNTDGAYHAYLYPEPYGEEFAQAADRSGVDPALLVAVSRQESLFDPRARSPVGARGLMQLMPATAAATSGPGLDPASLDDPGINSDIGARYLKSLLDRYEGRLIPAVAAYNAGPDAVARWQARAAGADADELVELISFRETKGYVKAVLRNYRVYRARRGGALPASLRLG